MTERDRALTPLNAVSASIEQLETYRTPQELAESLQAIGQAVERSLRQLLRADTKSPDELRLIALSSDDLPADRLVSALRDSNVISPRLATLAIGLQQAVERAASNTVRAADADLARETIELLRSDVVPPAPVVPVEHAAYAGPGARPPSHTPPPPAPRPPLVTPSFEDDTDAPPHAVKPTKSRRGALIPLALIAGLALATWLVFRVLFSPPDPMASGIEAFEQRRWGIAEQNFRTAIGEDEGDATARLYLARVLRAQGRTKEAGEVLNQARKQSPKDADIMRELGHVFMDLKQSKGAVSAYRQAQELEPSNAANWVGLVRALRAAGDPSAAEVLRSAPAEARATLGTQ